MSETVIDEGLKIEDIKGQVMSYVKNELPLYKTWSNKNLKEHLSFYFNLGQIVVSQKEDGSVCGVLAFQLINSVEDRDAKSNDPEGLGVHIDIFIADSQQTRERLVGEAMAFTGVRQWISFERCKYSQRLSKLPWKLAERISDYGRRW